MTAVFLILDPDPYVAEDLSEIVRETVPGAQVIHAPEIDRHTMTIVDEMSVVGVFLSGFAEDEASRAIVARLSQRGVALARIGTTGERRVTSGGPGACVQAPFTGEAVANLLRQWTRDRDRPVAPPDPGLV
ncbi:hypothetical protein [Jannaschia formosa]|uniref:hypothetical protein n=1 Tax=Jannaschia formosa TaxID=2259592 RepID=UPI000E1C3D09|nr:hypothetical protein [Jannaschia formosa]TFL19230.1 hypothetical protein DR046_04685 [Jannaschia formosa]